MQALLEDIKAVYVYSLPKNIHHLLEKICLVLLQKEIIFLFSKEHFLFVLKAFRFHILWWYLLEL